MKPRSRPAPPRLWGPQALLRLVLAVTAAVVGYYVFPFDRNGVNTGDHPWRTVIACLAFLVLLALLARQIRALVLGGRRATIESLIFLIALVILVFATTYLGMAGQFAGLATKTDALYFTVTTVSTVGFGDVHAVGQAARVVVIGQMIFDLGYLAVVASVITGLVRSRLQAVRQRTGQQAAPPGEPSHLDGPGHPEEPAP